jgi:hypothetical protein
MLAHRVESGAAKPRSGSDLGWLKNISPRQRNGKFRWVPQARGTP